MTHISDLDAHDLIMGARTRKLIDEGTYLYLTDYITQVRQLRRELHEQNEQHMFQRDLANQFRRQVKRLEEQLARLEDHCARLERRTSR